MKTSARALNFLLLSCVSCVSVAQGSERLSLAPLAGRNIEGTITSISKAEEYVVTDSANSATTSEPGFEDALKSSSMKTVLNYRCNTAPGPDAMHVRVACNITTTNWIKPAGPHPWDQSGQSKVMVADALYDIASSTYQVQTYDGVKTAGMATANMLAAMHGIASVPKALEQVSLVPGETSHFDLKIPLGNDTHKAQVLSRVVTLSEATATVQSSTTLTPEALDLAADKGLVIEYKGDSTSTFRRDDGILLSAKARMKFRMQLGLQSVTGKRVEMRFTSDITQAHIE
ncbi:hypothetical protein LNV23_00700 [Paucibacter sp. DJ1R-11]|uniref:hypothetical protein n=1 Tax=Paucibacter sp. DJ1R-11 TaxID=2893556 RepID=UPI0021E3BA14|nr:hypothetical protein [Paucibacter sp. DJ1R-11]MCV2361963.1 hypothetical protein [Paucibacter sp. DJ1R-11]